jgi:hypothetical protein
VSSTIEYPNNPRVSSIQEFFPDAPEVGLRALEFAELAPHFREITGENATVAVLGAESSLLENLCRHAIRGGLIKAGDTIDLVAFDPATPGSPSTAHIPLGFADWLRRSRRSVTYGLDVELYQWNEPEERDFLHAIDFDLIVMACERPEEVEAFGALMKYSRLCLLKVPRPEGKIFEAAAEYLNATGPAAFGVVTPGHYCIPMVPDGRPEWINDFLALARACRSHAGEGCGDAECAARHSQGVLEGLARAAMGTKSE